MNTKLWLEKRLGISLEVLAKFCQANKSVLRTD